MFAAKSKRGRKMIGMRRILSDQNSLQKRRLLLLYPLISLITGGLVCLLLFFSPVIGGNTIKLSSFSQSFPLQKASPLFEKPDKAYFEFQGFVGGRIHADLENWLLQVPEANPAILQMFRDRDRKPRKYLVPWAGEFAGKYLISLVQALRMIDDNRLSTVTQQFVDDLIKVQGNDGYLGPHPQHERLTGRTSDGKNDLWDVWGHYHCMLGLLLWYQESGYKPAFDACLKAADLICGTFLDTGIPVLSARAEEMNLAVSHIFTLLYQQTGNEKYLRMARQIEKEWEVPPAGDYIRAALAGKEFYQFPKPRWESLHDIQAIAELYFITGDVKYKDAFERIWWSIVKGDRHNTGGFSSGEQATGNPYDPRAIETCCTVAWIALSIDMLRMTGNSLIADEIELSTFNGNIGGQTPSGRWWTYNTPMDGVKRASAHEINFQCQIGGPELNCCSVNAPRGLGMLSEWAIMKSGDGIVVNYYGHSTIKVKLPSGSSLSLIQNTNYPVDGAISLTLMLDAPERFSLKLRIPSWSSRTVLSVNGETIPDVVPANYVSLSREWKNGDVITLLLDMSFHYWVGEKESIGKVSIYQGPILLAYDQRYNSIDPDEVPSLDVRSLQYERMEWTQGRPQPWILLKFKTSEGKDIVLCDFASAGAVGTYYRSWLPIYGLISKPFSKERPIWTTRLE